MNNQLFPNLFPSNVLDHPNKKDLSDNGLIKVNIPVLYVLFDKDFTNSNFEAEASLLVNKLRITLNRVKDFYLENSYGRFTFDFKVKTTLLSGNYQIAYEYSKNALNNLNSDDVLYSWDDNLNFEEFLDFGVPKEDTQAFVLFYGKVGVTGGGVRNYNTSNSKFDILGRTLNQFVYAEHRFLWELESNGRGWTVAAHELGHTLKTPDLYNMNIEGFLGDISMMGNDWEAAHFDAFLKLRFGWIQPQIISPTKYKERLYLSPIYQSKSNCILIYPDKIGYPDELFLLELRLSSSTRWDGKITLFDKSLNSDQQGLFIYHINTLNPSNTEPRIDLEGDQTTSGANLLVFNQTNRNVFSKEDSKFYNGQNSGLEVKITDERNQIYELEVSWNFEKGTGEFNQLQNDGKLSRVNSFEYWRKTWHTIIGGSFGRSNHTDLFFYDKENGEAEFYTTDGRGNIQRLGNLHTGYRKTWHTIIGGSFGRSNHTDLLFYDQINGVGEFYTTDGNGNIQKLGNTHSGWRKTWNIIISINTDESQYSKLLFYDAFHGHLEIYQTNGNGKITLIIKESNIRRSWNSIVGNITLTSQNSSILFYDSGS